MKELYKWPDRFLPRLAARFPLSLGIAGGQRDEGCAGHALTVFSLECQAYTPDAPGMYLACHVRAAGNMSAGQRKGVVAALELLAPGPPFRQVRTACRRRPKETSPKEQ